ncbi:hypothetical protein ACFE04_007630 [Oxalis oulophora]
MYDLCVVDMVRDDESNQNLCRQLATATLFAAIWLHQAHHVASASPQISEFSSPSPPHHAYNDHPSSPSQYTYDRPPSPPQYIYDPVPVKGEPWSAAAAAVNTLIAINPSIASHKSPHSSSAQQHSTTTAQQWRQSTTAAPQHNSNTTQHISGGYTQVYKYGNSIMVENIDRTL